MTRKEFDQIVYETLVAMGDQDDAMQVKTDPEWDVEFEGLKHLSVEDFMELCGMGILVQRELGKAPLN